MAPCPVQAVRKEEELEDHRTQRWRFPCRVRQGLGHMGKCGVHEDQRVFPDGHVAWGGGGMSSWPGTETVKANPGPCLLDSWGARAGGRSWPKSQDDSTAWDSVSPMVPQRKALGVSPIQGRGQLQMLWSVGGNQDCDSDVGDLVWAPTWEPSLQKRILPSGTETQMLPFSECSPCVRPWADLDTSYLDNNLASRCHHSHLACEEISSKKF